MDQVTANSRERLITFYKKSIVDMEQRLKEAMTEPRKIELRKYIAQSKSYLERLDTDEEIGLIYVSEG